MGRSLRVCYVSTFSPTQCGIATYTEDLIAAMSRSATDTIRIVYESPQPNQPVPIIDVKSEASYEAAGHFINRSDAEVVSIQHEFSLYGGTGGNYVLKLIETIKKPIVLTLHTVTANLRQDKREIITRLASSSKRVVVLTRESARILSQIFDVPIEKIIVIPHGIPEVEFAPPCMSKLRQQLGCSSSLMFVSAGHRRPTKGYHVALEALAKYRRYDASFKYVIVGTHQRHFSELADYHEHLLHLAERLQISENLIWVDSYIDRNDLLEYIKAADVGLVTYTRGEENASGILPLFLGCGRVVIATEFECAKVIKAEVDSLILAHLNDPVSICREIVKIAASQRLRSKIMQSNYEGTRQWLWSKVAKQYRDIFEAAYQ